LILYEDEALLVVDKPAGLLSHPTARVPSGTLLDLLADHLGFRPNLVHRLDRDTSGLMVVAKTPRAHAVLAKHFAERRVTKAYVALVHGTVDGERVIEAPIGKSDTETPRWRVLPEGRPSTTRLRTLQAGDPSRVELEPVTGRTNQLRIHCAFVGHPIVGDRAWGSPDPGRLCLHAARLDFHHPVGGRWMTFSSGAPF
jgi:RluA family pseudouridine synthase